MLASDELFCCVVCETWKVTLSPSLLRVKITRSPEIAWFAILIIVLGALIWQSDGFYPIDEGAHFISDAAALRYPSTSLGVWQRFGSVWLFALPAQFGHKVVKIFGSILFLVTVFITYKVAEIEGIPGKEWVVALAGLQPAFLDISFTCMPELPASTLLILSYYLYRKSRLNWSVFAASLTFLFRYEMFIFAGIILLIVMKRRAVSAVPYVFAGPAIWYFFSCLWTGDPAWLGRELLRFSALEKYKEGVQWFHYLVNSPVIFGWIPVGLFVIAFAFDFLRKTVRSPLLYLGIFLSLTISTLASSKVFHWTGSVGDVRYLTPISPFMAVIALEGLAALRSIIPAGVISRYLPFGLAGLLALQTIPAVKPHHLDSYEKTVISLTQRAAADTIATPILSNHWASRLPPMGPNQGRDSVLYLSKETLSSHERAYVLWDPKLANSPFTQKALTLSSLREDSSVSLVDSVVSDAGTVFLFLKDTTRIVRF
jgi:hypothetical protein